MFTAPQEYPSDGSLASDLLHLYDEFTEFNDQCAFLCEAYSAIVIQEEGIHRTTAIGFQYSTDWLRDRMEELKAKLKRIQKKSTKQEED